MKEIFLNKKKFDNKKKAQKALKFRNRINRRARKKEQLFRVKEYNRALFNLFLIDYPIGGLYKIWETWYCTTNSGNYGMLVDIKSSDDFSIAYFSFMGAEKVFTISVPTTTVPLISQVQVSAF